MASQNLKKKSGKYVTRRDFLRAGGAVIASAVLFNSLSSCTTSETTEATTATTLPIGTTSTLIPKFGGTLKMTVVANMGPFGWPPESMFGGTEQFCAETLLRGDNKGGIQPWLAESYKIADDFTTITFNLRKGITFHDGSDFNAAVAKWNLDNMIAAEREPSWVSVDLIDDYTIRANFTKWSVTIPMSFAEGRTTAFMVSKAAFDKNGLDWMRWNLAGTGPFKQVFWQRDVGTKYVKNPDYWKKDARGNQLPYLDGTDITYISDYTTQRMAFDTDVVETLRAQAKDVPDYDARGFTVKIVSDTTHCLIPDTANADSPWANQKVREAAEYAIDREAFAKAFGFGFWEPIYQIPCRDSTPYDPNFTLGRKYDPEKAKQLLAEAGYPDGFTTTITVAPFGLSTTRDPISAVQSYFAKVGIRADTDYPDMGRYMSYVFPGTWAKQGLLCTPIARQDRNFIGGIQALFDMVGSSWLRTPEFTQAYQAAVSSPTPDVKLVRAVTDLLTKEALVIPLCEDPMFLVEKPYLINVGNDERNSTVYSNVEDYWLNK